MAVSLLDLNFFVQLSVADSFADLICEGTRDDKWAIEQSLVQNLIDIILHILDKVINYIEEDINNDYVHFVLNSIKGRTLKVLIFISLYIKRNYSKENNEDTNWNNELSTMFKRYMDSDILDAYILFGEYLPQFMFLDRKWTIEMVKSITYDHNNWEGFMVGYIYSGTIYKDIYILMKTHYMHSIFHNFKNEKVIEEVANHIALGYLNGFEDDINNQLIERLLDKWDYDMISKVLWFFWSYDHKLGYPDEDYSQTEIDKTDMKKLRLKIIDFWDKLYTYYKGIKAEELSDNDKKLISDSIKLIGILDNIDKDSIDRIRFAIPYVEVNYNTYYFIEKISGNSFDEDSITKRLLIGELMLDLVNNIVPTYPEEKIIKIVNYLYEAHDEKVKEYADSICNIYAKNNIEFLRDIYLKYSEF